MVARITPFLWYEDRAEAAADFYVSIFPDSRITEVVRYGSGAPRPKVSAMTVAVELDGQPFVALNGGPHFKSSEAVSLVVRCSDQYDVDYY